jgi:ferredoxin
MTLRDVTEYADNLGAEMLGEYLECACSGVMACSTCHVIIDPGCFHMVGPPDDAEQVP